MRGETASPYLDADLSRLPFAGIAGRAAAITSLTYALARFVGIRSAADLVGSPALRDSSCARAFDNTLPSDRPHNRTWGALTGTRDADLGRLADSRTTRTTGTGTAVKRVRAGVGAEEVRTLVRVVVVTTAEPISAVC